MRQMGKERMHASGESEDMSHRRMPLMLSKVYELFMTDLPVREEIVYTKQIDTKEPEGRCLTNEKKQSLQ